MDLNVRETLQIKEIILVQRCLEGQAPGEAVATTAWFWNVKTGLGAGKEDQENQVRQRRKEGCGVGETSLGR